MNLLTELKESLNISMRAVRGNKMRSVLTTLGIVIGIVSVTLMATAIEGVNRAFERSAAAFGTDVLYVQKFPWVGNEDWATIRNRRNLEVSYAAKIERQTTMIDAVAPVVGTRRRVSYGNNSMEDAFVSGTTHQYISASGTVLADGRFFSAEESTGGRPVCAIGANIAENLFPKEDPRSTISPVRRLQTCQTCHPSATASFAKYDPHADPHDKVRNPILSFTSQFMKLLLGFVFAFFGVHTLLWLPRSWAERRRLAALHGEGPKAERPREGGEGKEEGR